MSGQKYFFDNLNIKDPYAWTFQHKQHVHFIIYKKSNIVGYAHIQLWPEDRAAIRIIVIDEDQRHQTFGRQFITLIEKWLKTQGYESIHAESSPGAVGFYKKSGYLEIPFNDPDEHQSSAEDIPMGKVL